MSDLEKPNLTPNIIQAVPIVGQLLDRFNERYGGDLVDYLGPTWREELGELLFNAWADGYTTGFANQQYFTNLKDSE